MIDGIDPDPRHTTGEQEMVGEMLSVAGSAAHDGTSQDFTDELATDTNASFKIRTTLVSDFIDGKMLPTAVTQSMIATVGNVETILINVDEDSSDPGYGIALTVNFDELAKLDIDKIFKMDFNEHEVMFGVLRAAISNRKKFEEQEPFWKRRFISEIFRHLDI